jgi:MFS transporter, FHS family, glucose/mannose:H+ symporter
MQSSPAQPRPASTVTSFGAPGARQALAGFFVSGMLLAFLGSILPSWGYHLTSAYETVGEYFLASAIGILLSARLTHTALPKYGIRTVLTSGCAIACLSILYLGLVSPPAPAWTRMIGLFFVGASAGMLHGAIFKAISPIYRHDPAATVNLGGTLFGLGCLTIALLISGTFEIYTVPSVMALLAAIPGLFAVVYSRVDFGAPAAEEDRPISDVVNDLRSPSAVLFTLLVFFQFGNEWAIAGWLPLFLIQRLGVSPALSLQLLALYWLALIVGRIVAQSVLPHVRHTRLLMGSVVAAMFGCLILSVTNNRFGAMTAILLIGAGFAPIYPLVVERIGDRFPYYHPGFYNGIFSFAFFGGLLAPCMLGWFAEFWTVQAVTVLPLFGTIMVLVLLIAIAVEARIPRQGRGITTLPNGPS